MAPGNRDYNALPKKHVFAGAKNMNNGGYDDDDQASNASRRAGPPSQTLLTSRRLMDAHRPLATSAASFEFQEDRASSSKSVDRLKVPSTTDAVDSCHIACICHNCPLPAAAAFPDSNSLEVLSRYCAIRLSGNALLTSPS
mmetsp:Transcript_77025/g.150896  ORF Transcript_77025/g.150896 Transcript_77025/m.150896 type:complete len:141 (-) Transcript_77025:274-696(-)